MKRYYVYILECNDGSFYTGITNNIERRLREHQSGKHESCYTYVRRPVKLVYCDYFHNPNNAIAFEKQIKGWSRKKKIALINSDWDKLKLLSRNYTQYGKPDDHGSAGSP